jgi:hypothetical protein
MAIEPVSVALGILSALEKLLKQSGNSEIARDYMAQLRDQFESLRKRNAELENRTTIAPLVTDPKSMPSRFQMTQRGTEIVSTEIAYLGEDRFCRMPGAIFRYYAL